MSRDDFLPLSHQVAGCHGGTPSSILINKNGQILKPYKPISNPTFNPENDLNSMTEPKDLIPVTLNELQFYAKLDKSNEADYKALRDIAPKYFGALKVNGIDHLLLEDFTHGMKYPCVMDLKIGKDRYYPGRSEEKAKLDHIKYKSLQEFGFCIAGIKICNPSNGEVDLHYMPKITRKFSSEEVVDHIKKFLHFDEERATPLKELLLKGGENVLNWSLSQKSILLRGSSLLFVYDAAGLNEDQPNEENLKARVGMIDFAHAFLSFGKTDENYVTGMKNLVHVLRTGNLPR